MERKSEQDRIARGYILSGWAAGPDTVCGFLWAAALFYVAASDETCKTYEGHTSTSWQTACGERRRQRAPTQLQPPTPQAVPMANSALIARTGTRLSGTPPAGLAAGSRAR